MAAVYLVRKNILCNCSDYFADVPALGFILNFRPEK